MMSIWLFASMLWCSQVSTALAGVDRVPSSFAARVVARHGAVAAPSCVVSFEGGLWLGSRGGGFSRLDMEVSPPRLVPARSPRAEGARVHGCAQYQGSLWAATEQGVARLDPGAQQFDSVWSGRATHIAAQGALLVVAFADGHLLERSPRGERRFDFEGSVLSLSVGPRGAWLAGMLDGRVLQGDGRGVSTLSAGPEPIEAVSQGENEGWLRTASLDMRLQGEGVMMLPDRAVEVFPAAPSGMLPEQLVDSSLVLHASLGEQEIFAHEQKILWRDATNQHALQAPGLPCGPRVASLTTFAGALWVGSFDRGLCRYDGQRWTRFAGSRYLPSDMVNDLAADDEQLYVATMAGLVVVNADLQFDQRRSVQCEGALSAACPWHQVVNGVSADARGGQVWVADQGALHRIDPERRGKRWKHYYRTAGVDSTHITRVASQGKRVAIGTADSGIRLGRRGKFRPFGSERGLADDWVMDLSYAQDGALWVGTCTRGVTVIAPDGQLRQFRKGQGLVHDYVLSVQEVDGRIWVGTLAGLSIVSPEGSVHLDVSDGLSGNEVHAAVSYAGATWVATEAGLSVVQLRRREAS